MNKLFTRFFSLLLLCSLGVSEIIAQPWTYDFGTGTGSFTTNNSNSTTFFPSTPSGGGSYRIRMSNNQGGGFYLRNPGTSLGTGSELEIVAASGNSTNKFAVYGWSSPSATAYVKFKMRTTSSAGGFIGFHIGSATTPFTAAEAYTTYTQSITAFQINYASGSISNMTRRNNAGNTAMASGHGFLKDTNQEIEVYANNAAASTTYTKGGTNTLNARSWDLWVDGVKISPSGGFFSAAGIAEGNNLNGFGFFAENNNNANVYIDDLEYSNSLPTSCAAPTETPEGFADFSTATDNSIDLEWLDGNGAGRVIKMNTTNSFTNLSKGANPTASTVYSGGEQVVYKGTGSSPIIITGLLPNTTYYFKGYEYCSPDTVYNNSGTVETVTTDIGDNIILTDAAGFGPFCNGTAHVISVGFDEDGDFNEDFKVQISNASGVFSSNLNDSIIGTGSASPISATIPVNFTTGTGYRVRVINADPITIGDDNGSNIVINATPTTPSVSTPAPVCEGTTINITGAGATNATSYTFWEEASGGTQITSGVSGSTLTTPNNLTPGNHSYYIQAENGSCSSLNRQEIVVTIHEVPGVPTGSYTYSANPSCGPATIGYNAGYYFQASASGTSTANPTSSTYALNSSGTVYVRAYNGNCWSDALVSNAVTVVNPVNITSQPANISVAENGSGAFSITATGVTGYQWQENDGNGWSPVGSNSSSLSISNPSASKNGYTYRVLLSANEPCTSVNSNVVALTVTPPAADTIWFNNIDGTSPNEPNKQNPFTSEDFANANITVSGIGRSSGITGVDAGNRYNANAWNVGAVSSTKYFSWTITPNSGYELDLTALKMATQVSGTGPSNFVIRTSMDGFASNVYSSATGTSPFNIALSDITGQVSPVEVRMYAYGASQSTGTFSVNDFAFIGLVMPVCSVADPSGTFSYSANPSCGPAMVSYTPGYYFQTSANGTSTSRPTSSAYTLNSNGMVYVRGFNGTCWSDAVASADVIVRNPILVSGQPQNRLVSSTGSTTMSVSASNVQSYQWQENDGTGWENISGATTSVLSFNNPAQSKNGYTYRVAMTGNSPCASVTSSAATLTVVTPSGPCSAPSGLNANVVGGQVTFNWTGSESSDIHAVLLTDVSTGNYSKGFSIVSSGTTVTVPSGTYLWKVKSLCNTAQFVTENASQWISGTQFSVP